MNPATIVMQASAGGVNLTLSATGTVKATGDQDAITRWLEIIREHKHGIIATLRGDDLPEPENDTRHFRWLLHFQDRDPVEHTFLPELTHAEVMAWHPDAIAAEPMPERYAVTAIPAQETELRALVAAVGVVYAFTHEELREALALALGNPDAALISYRAMAAEQGIILDRDNRRRCDQCANLTKAGKCIAWQAVNVRRGYEPVRDIPRRCEGYQPGLDDPDRRHGRERWPGLIQKGDE